MRFPSRLLLLSLFVSIPSGFVALAQTSTANTIHDDDEDLRETVRQLTLRVSALEEELHRQRAGAPVQSASLKPAMLVLPTADVRSSVERISSSDVAEAAPVATVSAQAATTQNALAPTVLPTQLPGGATLNYMFDGYYDYDSSIR
jgi:hypothetical protein